MVIYFWQQMIATHMAGLAKALAGRGHDVTFVANTAVSDDRATQGWHEGDVGEARLVLASAPADVQEAAAAAPHDAIHITQGLRGNGLVGEAQRTLRYRGARIWVIHEKIDDRGLRGYLKHIVYRQAYRKARPWAERLLAIGDGTDRWAVAHGYPKSRTEPFAYFLEQGETFFPTGEGPLAFCYAGRLVELKRVDLLIDALRGLGHQSWSLDVVGDGPLGPQLRGRAGRLDADIRWHGTVANEKAREIIAQSDCLVLPSDYDGWGAVASEALLAGTRVICSSACGSAAAVREDSASGVFRAGNVGDLRDEIAKTLGRGKVSPEERGQRRSWAACALASPVGAEYLEALIEGREVPVPWRRPHRSDATA